MGIYREEESFNREEVTLVDFLYKDTGLIDSFYSQIFGGNLTNLSKSEVATDESHNTVGCGVPIAKLTNGSKQTTGTTVLSSINPLDDKVIKLLETFNLDKKTMSECSTGSIVALSGELIFRDFEALNKLIPFMSENNMVPEFSNPVNPTSKGKDRNFTIGKMVTQLFKMMPYGLEFELITSENENALCIIQEDSLCISSNDILRSYGNNIPGTWTVIGLIDIPLKSNKKSRNDFKSIIDQSTEAFSSMLLDERSNIIRPIAIYRKLTT